MADGVFLASIDRYKTLEKDDLAFFQGARVDLKCVGHGGSDVITAVTYSESVPKGEFAVSVPSWMVQFVNVGDTFCIVDFKISEVDGISRMTSKDQQSLLPILHAQQNWRNVAEGFAGIGGWSAGSKLLGNSPVLMIEYDEQTAFACGNTWQIPVMYPSEVIQSIHDNTLPQHVVLIADINCVFCQALAGIMKVSTWLWSPPCQPWSKAGKQSGMQSPDGQAFVRAIMGLRLGKPKCINIENVPGLAEHKEYPVVKKLFDQVGYRIACSSIDKVHPLLPIFRKRWLSTVFPKDFEVPKGKQDLAFNTIIPSEIPGIGKETSIGAAGCVQSVIQSWEFEQISPSKETLELLSRYDLLPMNVRRLQDKVMSPEQVLAARTKSLRHCLPNVMAMQGSQHTLPMQHLQEKGLHAFLIDDGVSKRFSLPFEISVAMGFGSNITLPSDFVSAWRITGNALSVPHAALQCFRAHIMMGEHSPFTCNFKGCFDLCEAFRSQQILLDDFEIRRDKEWMMMNDWAMGTEVSTRKRPQGNDCSEQPRTPEVKRAHVSPTWEYQDHEEGQIIQAVPKEGEQVETHALSTSVPLVGGLHIDEASPFPNDEWIAFTTMMNDKYPHLNRIKVIHEQGLWAHFVWNDGNCSVGEILQKCLPHALGHHFVGIRADGIDIRFGTKVPSAKWSKICFDPCPVTRIVQTSVHRKSIPVVLDVTWKFKDLVSYIAAETAVLMHNMSVFNENSRIMKEDTFVLADSSTHFNMVLTPGYTKSLKTDRIQNSEYPKVGEIPETVLDLFSAKTQQCKCEHESENAVGIQKFRLAVRCPKWGSIRTAVFHAKCGVDEAIQALLPHFQADDQPWVVWNEVRFAGHVTVDQLSGRDDVELFFPGSKAWPVTALYCMEAALNSHDIDRSMTVGKQCNAESPVDIKGPFDFRAQRKIYPHGISLVQIAASFLGPYEELITMFTTQKGKGIDSRLLVEQIENGCPIHVRACALPGGAKKKADEVSDVLGKMLVKRGVPEADKPSRVNAIVSKIPLQELKVITHQDEQTSWDEIKRLANQYKIRLVTNQELKEHQKAQRAAKDKSSQSSGTNARAPKQKPFASEPKQVTIDVSLFHAAGERVATCDVGKFGPDMTGLAIVTVDQAEKFLPVSRLSADPLALLVLSPKNFAGIEPVQVPAQDGKDNPILTYIVLLNFGDIRVELKHSLPSATITEIPMTI